MGFGHAPGKLPQHTTSLSLPKSQNLLFCHLQCSLMSIGLNHCIMAGPTTVQKLSFLLLSLCYKLPVMCVSVCPTLPAPVSSPFMCSVHFRGWLIPGPLSFHLPLPPLHTCYLLLTFIPLYSKPGVTDLSATESYFKVTQ